jgi:hypothetical protein
LVFLVVFLGSQKINQKKIKINRDSSEVFQRAVSTLHREEMGARRVRHARWASLNRRTSGPTQFTSVGTCGQGRGKSYSIQRRSWDRDILGRSDAPDSDCLSVVYPYTPCRQNRTKVVDRKRRQLGPTTSSQAARQPGSGNSLLLVWQSAKHESCRVQPPSRAPPPP